MDCQLDDKNNKTMMVPSDQGLQGITPSYVKKILEISSTGGSDQDSSDRDLKTITKQPYLSGNYWISAILRMSQTCLIQGRL
jgi:hypothetical protein